MSEHVWQKCGKLYFKYFQFQKGYNSDKNWRKLMTLDSNLKFIKWKSYTKVQLNMQKHTEGKCGKLCISSIISSKKGITLTKSDDTRTLFDVHSMKVIYKISAQYAKACKRKMLKTVYFQHYEFQKGHNSYKYWHKLTTLEVGL